MTTEIETVLAEVDKAIALGDQTLALAKAFPLSQESETAPFLLFLLGETLEQISEKTNYPKETLALTARKYNWISRKTAFAGEQETVVSQIQKNIVNTLLVASSIAIQKELAMVISGEIDATQCKFIPKNVSGLRQLIDLSNIVNRIAAPGSVPIHGENIQVNFGTTPDAGGAKTKAEMLKMLADSVEVSVQKE